MGRGFAPIEDALSALEAGRVIIVADSEDRENEGDFLAAASTIDASMIHFMTAYGRGQLCMPVLPDLAQRLQLTAMVADASNMSVPRFTIPVDHRCCTTGISPSERAFTIRAMLDPDNGAEDFIRPGHIFPLIARPGGLLERTGHTESTVELARLAGLPAAGVLCEICSRDGRNMAQRDELLELAAQHNLPIITIDALVEYVRHESFQETAILRLLEDLPRAIRSESDVMLPVASYALP